MNLQDCRSREVYMRKIKAFLKKYPIMNRLYGNYKVISVNLLKCKLKFLKRKKYSVGEIININEAIAIVSKERPEPRIAEHNQKRQINKNLDLSIVVPVYNAEKFIKQCLDSLRDQQTDYLYQVICVDDGSTDSSGEMLEEYRADDRFLIVHQENKGHSGARNTALGYVLGQYLMFVDADDYLESGYIESMLNKAYRENADIVVAPFKKCNAESVVLTTVKCKDKKVDSFQEIENVGGAPWGKIYKSKLWDDIEYPLGLMFEDTIIFNVLFRRAQCIFTNKDCYYMYRVYGDNTLDRLQGKPQLLDAVWSIKYSYNLANRLGLPKTNTYYEFLLCQCSWHVYYRVKGFSVEIQKACFILMCELIKEYTSDFEGKNLSNWVLKELEMAFFEKDFKKWKLCAEILK